MDTSFIKELSLSYAPSFNAIVELACSYAFFWLSKLSAKSK